MNVVENIIKKIEIQGLESIDIEDYYILINYDNYIHLQTYLKRYVIELRELGHNEN